MYRFRGLRQLRLKLSISELTAVGTKEALQGRTFTGSKKIGQYQSSILIFGIVATLINHPFQINLVCLKLQDAICTMYEQNNYFLMVGSSGPGAQKFITWCVLGSFGC